MFHSPRKNEPFEGIIWSDDIKVGDGLHGCRASFLVVSEEPFLNIGSFKCDARGNNDGILHELHGNRAQEVGRNVHGGRRRWVRRRKRVLVDILH